MVASLAFMRSFALDLPQNAIARLRTGSGESGTQYLKCFTVMPLLINCFSDSIPILR